MTGDDGIYSAYLTGLVFNDTSSGKLDQELQLKVLVKSPGTFFPDTLESKLKIGCTLRDKYILHIASSANFDSK